MICPNPAQPCMAEYICLHAHNVFLVMPCCSQGVTLQVTLWCHLVGCRGRTSAPPPTPKLPPPTWFLGSSGNFKQLLFFEKKNWHTLQNFFSPKIFFTPNFFSPKIFLHPIFFFFIQNFFTSKIFFIQIFFSVIFRVKQYIGPPTESSVKSSVAAVVRCLMFLPLVTCSIFPGDEKGYTEVPAYIPPHTTDLWLYGNQISTLQSGAFTGLSNLHLLYLNSNLISTIQSGTFTGLNNLQILHLHNNQISTIQSGTFSGLSNLRTLDLNKNLISTFQSGTFTGLSNLQTLYLNSNLISTIQSGTFTGLSNLQTLALYDNQISTIQSGAFTGLSNLQSLYLQYNQISTIQSGTFSGLSNLKRLVLRGNNLTTIDSSLFINIQRPLALFLRNHDNRDGNPWECETLCWLKQEEAVGTILLVDRYDESFHPKCTDGSWESIQCPQGKKLVQVCVKLFWCDQLFPPKTLCQPFRTVDTTWK